MADRELPEAVVRFIDEHIDTVPHLESLLLLWRSGVRPWSATEIAARVYVSEDEAGQILADLHGRGLAAAVTGEGPARYRYAPEWDADGSRMTLVAAVYSKQLVLVTRRVHDKAPNGIREFARAFRLKKE